MKLIWSVVNGIAKAIAWGLALIFGILTAVIVTTVISITVAR